MKFLSCILLTAMVLISSCGLLSKSEEQIYKDGLQFLKKGDLYSAVEEFNKIDTLFPGSALGYYGRGMAYEMDFRGFDAINEYMRAIVNDPEYLPCYRSLMRLAARTDHPELALSTVKKYIDFEKDTLVRIESHADVLSEIGEYDLAAEELGKIAYDSLDNPYYHMIDAKVSLHKGDFESAPKHCSVATSLNSKDFDLLTDAGGFFQTIGRYDSAAYYYRQALNLEAIDYFQKAKVANAFIDMNYLESANNLLSGLKQESTDNHTVIFLTSRLLQAEGKIFDAEAYYSREVAKARMSPDLLMTMADFRWRAHDEQGAIMALENADAVASADSFYIALADEVSLKKPLLYAEEKDWRDAEAALKPLQGTLSLGFGSVYLQALVYLLSNNKDAADEALTRLDILAEDNPDRQAKFGHLYFLADSLVLAEKRFDQAIKLDKINWPAFLGKIEILKRNKNYKKAVALLEGQTDYFLFNKAIYPEFIDLYRLTKNLEKAREFVTHLIDAAPEDISRYQTAIDLANEADRKEDVEPLVLRCLKTNPGNSYANVLAANYYLEKNKTGKVRELLSSVISSGNLTADALYLTGLSFEQEDNIDSALVYYHKVVDENLNDGRSYGRLAAIMIDQNEFNTKTIAEITNYIRLAQRGGNEPEYNFLLGRVQSAQKRYKAAEHNFSIALESYPNNPDYNFYAGMNYIKLDSLKKARTHLNRAIKNGLNEKLESLAQSALDKL